MDVGKYFHHACVLDSHGAQVLSKRINQNEQALRALFSNFYSGNNKVLVVVDQPNNIGRLTVAVAQDLGIDMRYLPGLAMRQLSRIHAGNAKTDIRDAYIIAHAAKNLPESLRSVDRVEEAFRQLKVLNGIDEDLARSYTRLINQIRSALVGCYPQFEQADLTPIWWTPDIQPSRAGKKGNLPPCPGTENSSNAMPWPSMKTTRASR